MLTCGLSCNGVVQTVQAAKATPSILKMCGSQKLLDQLTECNKLLESVQKVSGDVMSFWCSGSKVCGLGILQLMCVHDSIGASGPCLVPDMTTSALQHASVLHHFGKSWQLSGKVLIDGLQACQGRNSM